VISSSKRRLSTWQQTTLHKRETSMPPVVYEPIISGGKQPQTYNLDRTATGSGMQLLEKCKTCVAVRYLYLLPTLIRRTRERSLKELLIQQWPSIKRLHAKSNNLRCVPHSFIDLNTTKNMQDLKFWQWQIWPLLCRGKWRRVGWFLTTNTSDRHTTTSDISADKENRIFLRNVGDCLTELTA